MVSNYEHFLFLPGNGEAERKGNRQSMYVRMSVGSVEPI